MKGDWIKLYLSRKPLFMGSEKSYEDSVFAVFGAPFDATSSYRPGARFAPLSIRIASENMGVIGVREVKLSDLGDLHPSNSVNKMLKMIWRVVNEIMSDEKIPVILGGEHTISLASALAASRKGYGILVFDAHLDLRNEFMDTRVNHATWLRRLSERLRGSRIMVVGARRFIDEELSYAKGSGIEVILMKEIEKDLRSSMDRVKKFTSDLSGIYLSIDIDVLDPSYAPGVGNPEPNGLSLTQLLSLMEAISGRLIGLDIVEVNPLFDLGQSSICAAYILSEALSSSITKSA